MAKCSPLSTGKEKSKRSDFMLDNFEEHTQKFVPATTAADTQKSIKLFENFAETLVHNNSERFDNLWLSSLVNNWHLQARMYKYSRQSDDDVVTWGIRVQEVRKHMEIKKKEVERTSISS